MFQLLGFPVHVRPGFVMFMLLIVALYGNEFGLWLAGSIAVLTLIHELGHAVAARRTGADAEISLDFLAGYASYRPTRELTRAERAWISFSGPAVQIAVTVVVLVAMGVNPLDRASFDDSAASYAIWWAGIGIGMLNLVPVLPLDGGNILLNGLDRLLPRRAERVMLWFSMAVTAGLAVLLFSDERFRGFAIFVVFLLVTQLQLFGATRRPARSPWLTAHEALQAGKASKARRILVTALSTPHPDPRPTALQLDAGDIRSLLALLPEPLPSGDPWNEYVLANLLIRIGRFEDAAHYAAASFDRHPNTLVATTVARAAGALGDQATAIGWLRAADDSGTSPAALATVIDQSPELIGVRQHPDVVTIRRRLAAPATAAD